MHPMVWIVKSDYRAQIRFKTNDQGSHSTHSHSHSHLELSCSQLKYCVQRRDSSNRACPCGTIYYSV